MLLLNIHYNIQGVRLSAFGFCHLRTAAREDTHPIRHSCFVTFSIHSLHHNSCNGIPRCSDVSILIFGRQHSSGDTQTSTRVSSLSATISSIVRDTHNSSHSHHRRLLLQLFSYSRPVCEAGTWSPSSRAMTKAFADQRGCR